ncbi:isocitrate lyase/phosphoenolpyruvate mutase family protein, partial [Rhizobium johnstonii]|uniref:isocitrate lyase/phosphoenolpyruvate mutase family protein n=1 Tax=Rhizobium johnstonii TaxID=3019933 RepID=UPI003F9BB0EE
DAQLGESGRRGQVREADDAHPAFADAIERGRAYLGEGATCVFVPGDFDENVVERLVEGIGERRVSVIGLPHLPAPARLAQLGVACLSSTARSEYRRVGAFPPPTPRIARFRRATLS